MMISHTEPVSVGSVRLARTLATVSSPSTISGISAIGSSIAISPPAISPSAISSATGITHDASRAASAANTNSKINFLIG